MDIKKSKNYTHIKLSKNDSEEFLKNFKTKYSEFQNDHLILDFSENINTTIDELLVFLRVSKQQRKNGTSFVIICKNIDIDNVPDEINIVPTFTEALDILEMDAIERDLGF